MYTAIVSIRYCLHVGKRGSSGKDLFLTRPGPEVTKLEFILRLKKSPMIGCLRTRVRKQPIIVLYFESETVLKFYNLGKWFTLIINNEFLDECDPG